MAKDIKFNIKLNVDGKEQIVSASTNVKELASNLGIAKDSMSGFRDAMRTFANVSMAIQGLNSAIQGLAQQVKDLTDAYAVQEQAEVQLATAMRNTMGASDEEIASIRELCAAQQQLGVIGDEVQLAGAKELALHVRSKAAIEALIPVMNDLAVKQDGLNVSSSTTASIAQMMGKALEGNTNALKRAGIFLSDAQQQALKFGTEEEKVRVLTEAITAQVGGMNAELAKTDSGRMQQMSNTIGDVKENLGKMVSGIAPAIQMAAQLGFALNGIVLLAGGFKTLVTGVLALGSAIKSVAASSRAAGIAIRSVFISSGIGVVIWGIVAAVNALVDSMDEATDSTKELSSAEQERNRVAAEMKVQLDDEIRKLGDLIKAKQDTSAAVEHLNKTYGDIFKTHKTAAEWYDVLISKSHDYCMQLGYQAQIQKLAAEIAEKQIQLEANRAQRRQLESEGRAHRRGAFGGYGTGVSHSTWVENTPEYDALLRSESDLTNQISALNGQMASAQKLYKQTGQRLGSVTTPTVTPSTTPTTSTRVGRGRVGAAPLTEIANPKTIEDLENNLKFYRQQVEKTNIEDKEQLKTLNDKIKATEDYISELRNLTNLQKLESTEAPQHSIAVTIPDPHIEAKGWRELQRELYERLSTQARTLKTDVEIGIIGADEAKEQLKAINKELEQMGLKPIELDIKTDSVENSVAKLGQSIASLGSAIDLPELNIAGTLAQAIATMTLAYAKAQALAAAGSGPIGWLAFAAAGLAQLTAIVSSVKSLNKFAEGGIAYGPTLGLFGEYAGARSNPEVVAPLDRLRSMIQPTGYGGNVRFHIEGRDLVGVLSNETRITAKSGRRL